MNSVHIKYKLYIRDLTFLTSFSQCDNVLVRSCFSIISNNANSILGNKLAYFREVTALLARWTEKLAGGPQAGTSDSPH